MSLQKCPLCGNEYDDEAEAFCPDCRKKNEDFKNFTDSLFPESIGKDKVSDEEATEAESKQRSFYGTPKPKNSKKILVWSIAILLTIVFSAGGYFWYSDYYVVKQEEQAFWRQTQQTNTSQAYYDYLNKYPRGEFVLEAQDKILSLNADLKKTWENVQKSGSEAQLEDFLAKYSDSPYGKMAFNLLDSIAWTDAQSANTQDAFKSYLDRSAQGKLAGNYKEFAQEKYNYLANMEFVGGDDLIAVQNAIQNFFVHYPSASDPNLPAFFAHKIRQYFNQTNISPTDVQQLIKEEQKKYGISSVKMTPDTENMKVAKDAEHKYVITIQVSEDITLQEAKKKKTIEKFQITLDSGLKILTINKTALPADEAN